MESFATPYPVIFHDGDREHDKGHIGVHSVLTFKRFQALLSQKVGLPAGQVSAVFVCRRSAKDTDTKRQKLPINENTNFNIILNQHNPKSEKNCHFLVSMKKSKKERKGSRRRSSENENGDDGSVSPRGDLSPRNEEDCKKGSCSDESNEAVQSPDIASENAHRVQILHEKEFDRDSQGSPRYNGDSMNQERLEHTSSPKPVFRSSAEASPQPFSSSPQSPHLAQSPPILDTDAQFTNSKLPGSSPQILRPWLNNGASSDLRPSGDKILLRRDTNNLGSPLIGWQNMDKAMETHVSAPFVTEMRSDSEKMWLKSEPRDVRPRLLGNDHNWASGQQFQRSIEGLPQERYGDPMSARSPVLLQRNGILNLSGTSTSLGGLPATRPLRPMDNMIMPRVSSGISSFPSGNNVALNLLQAQAHFLNFQAQQSEQMYLNLQALSKMRGVVRDLAAYENGSHKPSGVCQHCFRFQERNINPTPFHLCVHDQITNGFRGPSPAGPIERPDKRVEAAA